MAGGKRWYWERTEQCGVDDQACGEPREHERVVWVLIGINTGRSGAGKVKNIRYTAIVRRRCDLQSVTHASIIERCQMMPLKLALKPRENVMRTEKQSVLAVRRFRFAIL